MSNCHWGPFVRPSAVWAFMPLGSEVGLMLRTIWDMRCYLSILPIGSDVYLLLRIVSEHCLPFRHFCQLILMSVHRWRPSVSVKCSLGILATWFRHLSTVEHGLWAPSTILAFSNWFWCLISLRTFCFGEVFVWDSISVTSGEGLWQICHLMCECLLPLYDCCSSCLNEIGNSGSIH